MRLIPVLPVYIGRCRVASRMNYTFSKLPQNASAQCDPFAICGEYNLASDVAFYVCGVIIPIVTCFAATVFLSKRTMAKYLHHVSTFLTLSIGVVAIIMRYSIIEINQSIYVPGVMLMIFVNAVYVFLRARHVHVLVSAAILEALHFIVFAVHIYTTTFETSDGLNTRMQSFWTMSAAMLVTMGTAWFSCWENEVFYRTQFLAAHQLRSRNVKLINQLKTLQTDLGKKAADFDSPLEKSIMLLRSLTADATLAPTQIATLSQVLQLLGSSNLLTPDLEGQDNNFADNEQEEWLFSEIAQRKKAARSSRGPGTLPRARRGTITITDELKRKIGESIPEGSHDSAATHALPLSDRVAPHLRTTVSYGTENEEMIGGSTPVSNSLPKGASITITTVKSERSFGQVVQAVDSRTSLGTSPSLRIVEEFRPAEWNDEIATILQQKTTDYNFPLFDFYRATGGKPLQVLAQFLFDDCGFFDHFNLPKDKFRNFAIAIENGYKSELPCKIPESSVSFSLPAQLSKSFSPQRQITTRHMQRMSSIACIIYLLKIQSANWRANST